jgi:dUTP pyrophosphatase
VNGDTVNGPVSDTVSFGAEIGSVHVTGPSRVPPATYPGSVAISVRRLDPGLPLPSYAHPGDAGADLCAAADVTLQPGERSLVPTGVALAIPEGWVGLVHPRSGLAAKHGISIVNAPGTVDAGYRGEILVNLVNLDPRDAFTVRRGDRIAQLVVQQVARVEFLEVDSLEDTSRGDTGHGASGGFGDHTQTTKD